MRVSDSLITRQVIYRLNQTSSRLFRTQEQAASGLRFTKPSQDPVGAVQAATLRSSVREMEQYLQNIDIASNRLKLTEVAVGQIGDSLSQARTVAVSGTNDSLSDADRSALAAQIDQCIDDIARAANYHDGSRYLLSGQKVLTPPVTTVLGTTVTYTYAGDTADIELQVGRQSTVTCNLNAAEVLNMDGTADATLDDVFTSLQSLKTAIENNDVPSIQSGLEDVSSHLTRVTMLRGEIGARLQRVESCKVRVEEAKSTAETSLGEIEGADLAQTIVDLEANQTAYEAAAAAANMVQRASLLDYLR
jgi:flagellar hook-associated protein 3 FlgL